MKNFFYLFLIVVLAVSCTDTELPQVIDTPLKDNVQLNTKSKDIKITVLSQPGLLTRAISSLSSAFGEKTIPSDSLLIVDMSSREKTLFYFNEATQCFEGYLDTEESHEVIAIHPVVNVQTGDSLLLLNQTEPSTTEVLQNAKSRYWGHTIIDANTSNRTYSLKLYNIESNIVFNFVNSETGKPLSLRTILVQSEKGRLYQTRELNLHTGQFENGKTTSTMLVRSFDLGSVIDGKLFLSLFPTTAAFKFLLTDIQGNVYEGLCEQRRYAEGEDCNISIMCRLVSKRKETVEVCGIKWARGNLVYDSSVGAEDGFFEHWKLADSQWYYPDMIYGLGGVYVEDSLNYNTECFDVFNWGSVGQSVFNLNTCARPEGETDISAKLYTDGACKVETTDFTRAKYGDLAYWASKGKWRMPTEEELYTLYNEASYSFGYAQTDDGHFVWGYLFTTPHGNREIGNKFKYFTEEDLNEGLFLPGSGFRQLKSPQIMRAGTNGFYWHSKKSASGNIYTLRYIWTKLFWTPDAAAYGRTIRPVLVGSDDHENEPVKEDYIIVCGTKWARGNLMFSKSLPTQAGFMDNWTLSPSQWYFPDMVSGYQNVTGNVSDDYVYLFNWGVCGKNFNTYSLYSNKIGDISGQMFTDRACSIATNDYSKALYGDIAYWASKGQWRMPSEEEMYKLYTEASYSYGCYTSPDGIKIFGYLFWTPNGTRVVEKGMHNYTDADLENALFLPACGNREYKSDLINRIGGSGYYWDSYRASTMMQLSGISYSLVWRSTSPGYGRTVRPVKNDSY